MSAQAIDPAARLAMAATALALARGGMVLCDPLIMSLDAALRGVAPGVVWARLVPVEAAARGVVDARIAGDEYAFAEAQDALRRALAAYWRGRVLPPVGGTGAGVQGGAR